MGIIKTNLPQRGNEILCNYLIISKVTDPFFSNFTETCNHYLNYPFLADFFKVWLPSYKK